MINNINQILKEYLTNTMETIGSTEIDFSMVVPTKKFTESIVRDTINIYLLGVNENVELRRNEWTRNYNDNGQSIEQASPPIILDLYYIFSMYSKEHNTEEEYDLLSRTLVSLYRFSSSFKDYLGSDSKKLAQKISLEIFPQKYINEHLGLQLWSAIDQNARPLISLKITAPLDISHSISIKKVKIKEIAYNMLDNKLYNLNAMVITIVNDTEIPVEARIELKKQGGSTIIQTANCNAFGIFELRHLTTERFTLDVVAQGYQPKSIELNNIVRLSTEQLKIILDKV